MNNKLETLINALKETKLTNLVVYDLEESSPFFDYVVIVTAQNKRMLNSAISLLWEKNIEYDHIEGTGESGWILVDMNDIILNVMSEEMRELYSLDNVYIKYKKITF